MIIKFINFLWYNIIIKRNEFHKSLDLDINKIDDEKYIDQLYKKRSIAHKIEMRSRRR